MSNSKAKFKTGDTVYYTNSYGVYWGKRTIEKVEFNDVLGHLYFITPTDSPWCGVIESQLSNKPSLNSPKLSNKHFIN